MSIKVVFAKTKILSELVLLDNKYQEVYSSPSHTDAQLMKTYSKMALMTVGGWLEDGMEDLIKVSETSLSEMKNREKIQKMVEKIYGFGYGTHISQALILGYGIHGFEYIEKFVGDTDINILSSILGKFKKWRDDLAHSYRALIPCNPNMVINDFIKIFPILKKMEVGAKKYRNDHF